MGHDQSIRLSIIQIRITSYNVCYTKLLRYMVASNGDFMNLFYANREQPWVVDNTLTIDPMVYKMVETAKTFRDNGYEARATQWQEGWFAGMNDTLTDAEGNPKQSYNFV